MESRKRIIRQHIKSALQKTLLPLCYKLSKKKDIDKKFVILADLNSVSTPESMERSFKAVAIRSGRCTATFQAVEWSRGLNI